MMIINPALTVLLSVVSLATAHPGSHDARGIAAAEAAQKAGEMSFVGQIELGGPHVTLYGDAKSVYEQILELNPNYDPTVFPEYRQRSGKFRQMLADLQSSSSSNGTGLVERSSSHPLSKRDSLICDVGDWPGVSQPHIACVEGWDYLVNLNGYCGAPRGWGGCSRVSCSNSCGQFLCNDNPFPIGVWCGNIAGDTWEIYVSCERIWGSDGIVATAYGQVFRDQAPGWNSLLNKQSC
ncbi:hypothetical protein V8F06_009243 [Rhypophila decipiens]